MKITAKTVPYALSFVSALALSGAFISQYGFGLQPCQLCLYQRVPYALVLVLSIFIAIFVRKKDFSKSLLVISMLAFLAGTVIAVFHMGVEWKWWQGLSGCSSGGIANSIEELRAKIMNAPSVRCDEAQFVFLGLSMAGWNALYSLGLTIGSFVTLRRLKSAKK